MAIEPRVSFTPLWSGTWPNNNASVDLAAPASAFDAIRLSTFEDYNSKGSYKCSDIGANSARITASMGLSFYEGNWYNRMYGIRWDNGFSRMTVWRAQQTRLQSGYDWSATAGRNFNCSNIWGINYSDTGEYDPNKVYGTRTLLYSGANLSGKTMVSLSEPMNKFAFVQIDTNNPFQSHICPGSATRITLHGILQSDTRWYDRSTYWDVYNNYSSMSGSKYFQACLGSGNYTGQVSGDIPVGLNRNVQPLAIWGIGRL